MVQFSSPLMITGASGQVGRHVMLACEARAIPACGFARGDVDITRSEDVARAIAECRPSMILNCAAYTDVAGAEGDRDGAFAVNETGAAILADAANKAGIPIIHLSTDYVFPGTGTVPLREGDKTGPVNVYGQSKLAGELAVAASAPAHVTLRTAWVYSEYGRNFLTTMLSLADRGEDIAVVDDMFGTPTYAGDIAVAMLDIAGRLTSGAREFGVYHYVSQGEGTWFDFAAEIFTVRDAMTDHVTKFSPVMADAFPSSVERPRYTVLDASRVVDIFGVDRQPWQERVRAVTESLLAEDKA